MRPSRCCKEVHNLATQSYVINECFGRLFSCELWFLLGKITARVSAAEDLLVIAHLCIELASDLVFDLIESRLPPGLLITNEGLKRKIDSRAISVLCFYQVQAVKRFLDVQFLKFKIIFVLSI